MTLKNRLKLDYLFRRNPYKAYEITHGKDSLENVETLCNECHRLSEINWFSRNYGNVIGLGMASILIGLLAWAAYTVWSTPPDYSSYVPETTNNPPEVTAPKLIQYQVTHPVEGWECIEIRYDGELRDVQCK